MEKIKKVRRYCSEIESVVCDRCNKEIRPDDPMEYQEVYSIRFTGGYSSVFGDGAEIEADLCQQCLRDLIESFCRRKEE